MKKVGIVYYDFINPKVAWNDIILNQLRELKESRIEEVADIHIHVTGEDQYLELAYINIQKEIPSAIISKSNINRFEYDGIHLIWQLATANPEKVYLYFHSKGMCSGAPGLAQQQKLNKIIIQPWERILKIFDENPNVNKIGACASVVGWMWFNFWWARGNYLTECKEPIIAENRYYYESWLYEKKEGTPVSTIHECYNLLQNTIGAGYSPKQACVDLG